MAIGRVSGEQLLSVINDVLDLAKLEEQKIVLDQTAFSLRTVIEDAMQIVAQAAEQKNLELISDVESPLVLLCCPTHSSFLMLRSL